MDEILEQRASILRNYCRWHSMPSSDANDLSGQPSLSGQGMLNKLVRHQSSARNDPLLVTASKRWKKILIFSQRCKEDSRGERCARSKTWLSLLASSTLKISQLLEYTCGKSLTKQTIQPKILKTYLAQSLRKWRTFLTKKVLLVTLKSFLKIAIPRKKVSVLVMTVRMKSLLTQSVRSSSITSFQRRLESPCYQLTTSKLKNHHHKNW